MSSDDFESVHNYHERAVIEEVLRLAREKGSKLDRKLLADIAGVALKRLPPRYIRHLVDFSFYQTAKERDQNAKAVRSAVADAAQYVTSRARRAA